MINTSGNLSSEQKVLKLASKELFSFRTMGANALNRVNTITGGINTGTRAEMRWKVYKDVELVLGATLVTGNLSETVPTNLTILANGKRLIVGDVLDYKKLITLEVTAVNSATSISVLLIEGNDVQLTSGDKLELITNATEEGSLKMDGRAMVAGVSNYNLTQIVNGIGTVSATEVDSSDTHSMDKMWVQLRKEAVQDFTRNLAGMFSSRTRKTKDYLNERGQIVPKRFAGGIPFYTKNLFSNVGEVIGPRTDNLIAVNGVPSKTHINQAFIKAVNNRGTINTIAGTADLIAILASAEEDKVRILNAINSVAGNIGGGIVTFSSPISVDGNQITSFLVTDELPTGQILVYDRDAIVFETKPSATTYKELKPYEGGNGNNYDVIITMEGCPMIKNYENSFYYLTGCTTV